MKHAKLILRRPSALVLPERDARALLEAGNGDAALLYLHILCAGGVLDGDRAALDLHRSDRDIENAAERLRGMGLLQEEERSPVRPVPAPAEELPEYAASDIVRRSREDDRFRDLVDEAQLSLGRKLSSVDLNKLFGIYDELAMPPEVILLLIQYCKEEWGGKDKRVGFGTIEKKAYEWHHQEILTYEQAEQWLAREQKRRSALEEIRRGLGIWDRKLTPTERGFIAGWIDMGFPVESITMAADRTVTNTGGLKWKYMDSIIRSWDRMGLHTPAEIEAGDKKTARPGARRPGEPAAPRDDSKTMEQVKRLREKINNS